MATSVSRMLPATKYCPSCRGWPDPTQEFQKIIDLKNVGLAIYRHTVRIPGNEQGLADKAVEVTKEIFILENTNDVKISAEDFLPELEKQLITCSRCLKIVERALALLRNVPNINKNEVRGVCEHCMRKQKDGCDCDNAIRRFMSIQPSEVAMKRRREWFAKMRQAIEDESVSDLRSKKNRLTSEIKPSRPQIPKEFVKSVHSGETIPVPKEEKPEKSDQPRRKFSTPLFPERPALSDYAKGILLKMFKEEAEDAAEFLKLYSDSDTKEIEHILKSITSKRASKVIPETSTVRFRHSTDSVMFGNDKRIESYTDQYFDEDDINIRERIDELSTKGKKPYRDRYLDEDDFDRKQRTQQYRDRYEDEEDFDRKQRLDERAPGRYKYRDQYADDEDFDRKQRLDERAPGRYKYRDQYADDEDFDRRRHEDEKAPRRDEYRDQYDDDEDFHRKRRVDERAPRRDKYRDQYDEDERFDRKRHVDERAPRRDKYRNQYDDDEDFDRKRRVGERAPRRDKYRDQYDDDEDFDRKRRVDERAPRRDKYRDQYDENEDFDRKRHVDERAPRRDKYRDQYADDEDFGRKRHVDERAPRRDKYRDQYVDDEDFNRKRPIDEKAPRTQQHKNAEHFDEKRRIDEKPLKDKTRSRFPAVKDVESKQRLEERPSKPSKKDIEPQTISRDLLLQRRRFASKSGNLAKDFSFYFPKNRKTKTNKGNILSSVLIKETREKLEAKAEEDKEKKRRNEEETEKNKIEKKKAREEKAKLRKESQDSDDVKLPPEPVEEPVIKSAEENTKPIDKQTQKSPKVEKKEKGGKKEKKVKADSGEMSEKKEKTIEKIKESKPERKGKPKKEKPIQKKIEEPPKDKKPDKKPKKDAFTHTDILSGKKELPLDNIKIVRSLDDLVLRLIQLRRAGEIESIPEPYGNLVQRRQQRHKRHKKSQICVTDDIESDEDILECEKKDEVISDVIIGTKICKRPFPDTHIEKKEKTGPIPLVCKSTYTEKKVDIQLPEKDDDVSKKLPVDELKILHYALSDRAFIEKGWTVLPTERVVRKMNIYRMRPAKPEFNWFEHNKNKQSMNYDSGERLADFDENGCGRWYYKNGRVALNFYNSEDTNAQKRYIIYSSGEPEDRGHPEPYTILAVFDYLGNGIVYDHTGKVRLKYNQSEGILLDRNVGPETQWKWHTLNDPPVIQQIIVDTQMPYKDAEIVKLGQNIEDKPERENNAEMLAIEFENFVKDKRMKQNQTFKPFKIRMKALKINKHFSLKLLDQATIYLIYRDGSTNIKLNIGMVLDQREIIDTEIADLGLVYHSLEKYPAETESCARVQKTIQHAQNVEKKRIEHDLRYKIPEQSASVDKLNAAASKPMRPPLRTVPSCSTSSFCRSNPQMTSNVY